MQLGIWAMMGSSAPAAVTNVVLQDEIQHEETTANVKFLFIDCGPLKQTLIAHCELWKTKLTNLLNNLAAAELRSLHENFRYDSKHQPLHHLLDKLLDLYLFELGYELQCVVRGR